jgi:hypothetical protein
MSYQEKANTFVSETRGVTWTKPAEGGQRTEKGNSLINVLYTKLRIRNKKKKDRKQLRKIFDLEVFEGCSIEVGHTPSRNVKDDAENWASDFPRHKVVSEHK